MASIVPTVTAENLHVYRSQIELLEGFAERIHIDLMDGVFAPSKSPNITDIWLPEGLVVDMHIMYRDPMRYIDEIIRLNPNLVVIPSECDSDIASFIERLHQVGIKVGLALLQKTEVSAIEAFLPELDHVLIFSGNLGYQGGSHVDLSLLQKVDQIKAINSVVEIGWDGGVNAENAASLLDGGIDVLNVGGFIHRAPDVGLAYRQLVGLLP